MSGSPLIPEAQRVEYRKIVWPNDFSETAGRALPHVLSLAGTYGAEVHMIHVAPDLADFGRWYGEPSPEHVQHLHDFAFRKAQEKLEAFCRKELQTCSRFEVVVTYGDAAEQIVKLAKDIGADLIVMTNRGMRGTDPLGSVAEKVLRASKVPVLIVC